MSSPSLQDESYFYSLTTNTPKRKLRKQFHLTIAIKRIKYLEVNLKEGQHLHTKPYTHNYKTVCDSGGKIGSQPGANKPLKPKSVKGRNKVGETIYCLQAVVHFCSCLSQPGCKRIPKITLWSSCVLAPHPLL